MTLWLEIITLSRLHESQLYHA